MRKSVYAQLVAVLLGIIILSNLAVFFTFVGTTEKQLLAEMEEKLSEVVSNIKEIYASGALFSQRLPLLLGGGYFEITIFDDAESLVKSPFATRFFSVDELSKLSATGEVWRAAGRVNRRFGFPAAAFRVVGPTGTQYVLVYPDLSKLAFNFRRVLMRVNLTSLAVGSLLILLASKYIVKPIESLSKANERIARGDFDVHLPENRRDEIGKLVKSFNTMAKDLKGMEIMRNDFVSAISHEFKTPLTSIKGYTKLLAEAEFRQERQEYAAVVIEEAERLSQLSSNILLLNRLEAEDLTLPRESFRLDEQIRKCLLVLEQQWSTKKLELSLELEAVWYDGNEQLLHQVWLNLIDNAIKFSPAGASIDVNLTSTPAGIVFVLRDYGQGIPAEDQRRVFEKFFQADKSRATPGNGLGLAIVKRIVDIHGGSIELQSLPGQGVEVRVSL